MKKYIVGGAVRDLLLGRKPKDIDYVWVGATPDDMFAMRFRRVGADFPVFLDDEGNEHALARTERKTGHGYNGFETTFDPSVTLEDDLRRRDLTINAMALDPDTNEIIDPFGGQEDLKNGVLRHVSEAFAEDPLRVLRVARFAARYNFVVHASTLDLMRELVDKGEMEHLTKERVWAEMSHAIRGRFPHRFFIVLDDCGAFEDVLGFFPTDVHTFALEHMRGAAMLRAAEWERWMTLFTFMPYDKVKRSTEGWGMPTSIERYVHMGAFVEDKIIFNVNTTPELLEDAFRKFRFNQPENLEALAEVIKAGCLYSNWGKSVPTALLAAMEEAAAVVVSDPSLKGADYGYDLAEQRHKIFAKYFND